MRIGVSTWIACLTLVVVSLTPSLAKAQDEEPSVRAEVKPPAVPLGGETTLEIVVSGASEAEAPPLDAFGPQFDVDYLGGRNSSSRSIIFVNGVRREEASLSYEMTYRLRPLEGGELRIPELPVVVGGTTLTTRPLTLTVRMPRPSMRAQLELRVEPRKPYVEQPVRLTLVARVRPIEFEGAVMDRDPWVDRPPHLRIPWFRELDGFIGSDFVEWAEKMLRGSAGAFHVNDERSSSPFGRGGLLSFHLPHDILKVEGDTWREYRLVRDLMPTRAGRVPIPASTMEGTLITSAARNGARTEVTGAERMFVVHDDVALDVRPIPEDGRPATYHHAVGRYRAETSIEPDRVKVGDPVTLTLRVWGDDRVERALPPKLHLQESLAADFAVPEEAVSSEMDGTTKVFTYTIRPLRDDVDAVPAIEFASFDPEREEFVTETTRELELTVEETRTVGAGDMVDSGGDVRPASTPGEELTGGLLANAPLDEMLADETPRGAGALFWIVLAGAPLLYAGVAFGAAHHRRRLADPLRRAATLAPQKARDDLGAARGHLDGGDVAAAAEALHRALTAFVAARARRPAGGMTAADVETLLRDREVSDPGVAEALRTCEALRYGGGAGDSARLRAAFDAAPEWIEALTREDLA